MGASIPVVVVAGFLGAGKTTLVNHVLRSADDLRVGVLVNDFGAINIDAFLVAGQVDNMMTLTNGCICCEVDSDDIEESLASLAGITPRLDMILVEASGVAEPAALVQVVRATGDERFHCSSVIVVVDAAEHERVDLARQTGVADLVLLNKADALADDARDDLMSSIGAASRGAPVIPTIRCSIDLELLIDATERQGARGGRASQRELPVQLTLDALLREESSDHPDAHDHAPAHQVQSLAWTSSVPVHPRSFMELLEQRPAGVYRVKGRIDFGTFGDGECYVLQVVGRSIEIERRSWQAGAARRTELVLIGHGMDEAALSDQLDACVAAAPGPGDDHAMLRVLRFIGENEAGWP
ncbi:CobW family GTP-binding protein [Lolliginicoccus levis]|uniref:CobW family GTP-binding protein n=1 Tax=Lolliginicoccus levis TaxID=2919542 RepID=UPI00241C08AE|nr:GTP-binding protein [Lolliginicoccus levis]